MPLHHSSNGGGIKKGNKNIMSKTKFNALGGKSMGGANVRPLQNHGGTNVRGNDCSYMLYPS